MRALLAVTLTVALAMALLAHATETKPIQTYEDFARWMSSGVIDQCLLLDNDLMLLEFQNKNAHTALDEEGLQRLARLREEHKAKCCVAWVAISDNKPQILAAYLQDQTRPEACLTGYMKGAADQGPLHWAASLGHEDVASVLLADDPTLIDRDGPNGWSALTLATIMGRTLTARLLLDAGANPAHSGALGGGPIHAAAVHNRVDIARWLIEKGGSKIAEQPKADGSRPAHMAAQRGNVEILEVLVAADPSSSAQMLSEKIVHTGVTPLMLAALGNHVDVIKYLLNEGVSGRDVDSSGRSAIFFALSADVVEAIDLLLFLVYDSDVNTIVDSNNWTLLHYAAAAENIRALRYLLLAYADPTLRSTDGWTARCVAYSSGNMHAARLLGYAENELRESIGHRPAVAVE